MKQDLHRQTNPRIIIEEIWNRQGIIIIDARTPKEFAEGCIPEAVNIPLLSDVERSTVGTLYKMYGQEKAITEGYSIFEPKLAFFRNQFSHFPKDQPLTVYCARGGMRSQVITSFLRALGYQAKQVDGGYKAFRKWNLNRLDAFVLRFPFILHGKTGVGKTRVINRLENSLDLEGLAQHRGSMFGAIGKKPVSQKTFEAKLLQSLEKLDNTKPIFIEGESRKIGNVVLPNALFKQMSSSRVILLEASIETRVARIIEEYITGRHSFYPQIRKTIGELKKDLGKKNTDRLQEQFDAGEYEDCFKYILENYYDRKYSHSMKELVYETVVSTEDISETAARILRHTQ